MRGNELGDPEGHDLLQVQFPIPMRGNELMDSSTYRGEDEAGFPIPMRGNEVRRCTQ